MYESCEGFYDKVSWECLGLLGDKDLGSRDLGNPILGAGPGTEVTGGI